MGRWSGAPAGVGVSARWVVANAVGWAAVGGLLPVCFLAVRVFGAATWPAVALAGGLAGGALLGGAQARVGLDDTGRRADWTARTALGVVAAFGVVFALGLYVGPAAGAARWPVLGAAAGLALGLVQTGSGRRGGAGRWMVGSAVGSAVLLTAWAELWGGGPLLTWANGVTRPVHGWHGETAQEFAAWMLVGLASGGLGGVGYGAVTAPVVRRVVGEPRASAGASRTGGGVALTRPG